VLGKCWGKSARWVWRNNPLRIISKFYRIEQQEKWSEYAILLSPYTKKPIQVEWDEDGIVVEKMRKSIDEQMRLQEDLIQRGKLNCENIKGTKISMTDVMRKASGG